MLATPVLATPVLDRGGGSGYLGNGLAADRVPFV
jgi:hypothetical protein